MKIQKNYLYPDSKYLLLNFGSLKSINQSYNGFKTFVEKSNFLNNMDKIILNPQNFIAEGGWHKLYKIPNKKEFLLKISKKKSLEEILKEQIKFEKVDDFFENYNFGQKIAKLNEYIFVVIKQKGTQNGVKNWHLGKKITKNDIPKYISDLTKISEIDQKGFNQFAKEVKFIISKKYHFDYNPNNILVNKSSLNIVDVDKRRFFKSITDFHSREYLLFAIFDRSNFDKILKVADIKQKNEIKNLAKIIIEKVNVAADKNDLPRNKLLLKLKFFYSDFFTHTIRQNRNEYKNFLREIKKINQN